MKQRFILTCLSAVLFSLVSCVQEPVFTPVDENLMTLSVGFEERMSADNPQEADTKTYLQGEKVIQWGSSSQDKVIYVFDTNGIKNVFNSAGDAANGPAREFKGVITEESQIDYVIWTGEAETKDQCSLKNGVFGGPTLKVKNPQNINNTNSFDNGANIAVMKPGDTALRNAFGYIKYTIPAVDGIGAIKSVTFSADEPLAGMVQIDYTGDEPVTTIVEDGASTSLTVNTRVKNGALEAGNIYAVLPAGTYTNFNTRITLADDTFFDWPATEPVVIERGKYTSAGTLPLTDQNAPQEPEEPAEPTIWPNDPSAFDYGLDLNESRLATYPEADRIASGVTGQGAVSAPALIDGITYGAPGITFYGNRMTIDQVKSTHWSEEYPEVIPTQRYVSFKINRPGSVSFYQSTGSQLDRIPTYYMALVTTINGVTSAKIVDEVTPAEMTDVRPGNSYEEAHMKHHITLTVSQEDMAGITEPATVYIYHCNPKFNTILIHYYPLTWTSGAETNPDDRKPKVLLAGDSIVTEYGESSAPQAGWGQCLAPFLGTDVKVRNYAKGGESSKSFINTGRWANLLKTVLSGDVVLIWFMHNDRREEEEYRTDAATTYRDNLRKYISDTREKGGVPVLVTSLLPYKFGSDGKALRSLGAFPDAMRAVAQETETLLIDVEQWSYEWLSELGEEGAAPYYLLDKRDPENWDAVHITKDGGDFIAEYIANEMIRLGVWVKQ